MDSIELRSEKVRSIIGKIPSIVVRSGISILFAVFLLLLIGSYSFPYTETIQVPAQIIPSGDSSYSAQLEIPIALQSKIEQGLPVMIEVEGYTKNKYGQLFGNIEQQDSTYIIKETHKYLIAKVNLEDNLCLSGGKVITYYPSMQGKATILLKKERLLKVIFGCLS
ncbi:MAG: hypothetical protein LBH91_07640 [Prevotellaceae bacterium]|jgi:hypothetical protein|nr:hypothetical protein [Prevotellaceae bacterium]